MNVESFRGLEAQDRFHEAIELFNLESHNNSSLLSYGLNLGFIERRPRNGRLMIQLLNVFPMSEDKLIESLVVEFFIRLSIFIPAANSVKLAIDTNGADNDSHYVLKCVYIVAILTNHFVSFDEVSIRTINRLLMGISIILFSLTRVDSQPCADMQKFKRRIRKRLLIDYYLWCLLFAMSFALTCASPIFINLERSKGIDLHLIQMALNKCAALQLCSSMGMIGHSRLVPLIIGTPLLFLDVGDQITIAKATCLAISYFLFWLSDWREMVDWNHSMMCEAGICKILNTEPGSLEQVSKKAKVKFDEWRVEEGLDDDGWFILLDAPNNLERATSRPNQSDSNSPTGESHRGEDSGERRASQTSATEEEQHVDDSSSEENPHTPRQEDGAEREESLEEDLDDAEDITPGQQLSDFSDRVIYLQSRNPLLTSLATIMLLVWK